MLRSSEQDVMFCPHCYAVDTPQHPTPAGSRQSLPLTILPRSHPSDLLYFQCSMHLAVLPILTSRNAAFVPTRFNLLWSKHTGTILRENSGIRLQNCQQALRYSTHSSMLTPRKDCTPSISRVNSASCSEGSAGPLTESSTHPCLIRKSQNVHNSRLLTSGLSGFCFKAWRKLCGEQSRCRVSPCGEIARAMMQSSVRSGCSSIQKFSHH